MDRYERILTLHRILKSRRYPVALPRLMEDLGCSRATLYRDIAFLRDALGAPIESGEGETAAFRYAADEAERFELPGLWLTSEELSALIALEALLEKSGPGILASALAPLRKRIEELLSDHAVDRIAAPQLLDEAASDRDEAELDQHLAGSYGIFSGAPKAWATLRFSAHSARWVADEHWHSQQQGSFLPDGRYELRVPYSNSRELLMDVLKYGPEAEVVAPLSLREEMKILLQLAIGSYQGRD